MTSSKTITMRIIKTILTSGVYLTAGFLSVGCDNVTTEVYNPEVGEGMYILTPPEKEIPQINGADVFGVRPSHPFLYTIAATGVRPMNFSAEGMPEGLSVDPNTGVISGVITSKESRTYPIVLKARNDKGEATQQLDIIVGEEICLTPPLGWNSWNCWEARVTQENVENSAKAMYDKGLVNYGWSYVNIDDGWQGDARGGKHNAILPDTAKFPDMQAMCDRIHAMGLKVGIYSTPWMTSYAKYIGTSSNREDGSWDRQEMANKDFQIHGKYKFDQNDANQWADWGIDYLKYDWYLNEAESTIRMAKALRNSGRDIVFSLSNSCPIELEPVCREYAQVWRTTGDLKDRWDGEGWHKSITDVWPIHREWANDVYEAKAGHFPDPDMLVVGMQYRGKDNPMQPSALSADEQYSHIALWSLWSAPLLIGCPVEQFDDFTLALLTNAEVLDIQQDRLATPGKSVRYNEKEEIIVKPLHNGNVAVGLFNLGKESAPITVDWATLGVEGKQSLRDAWRQKEIGDYRDSFTAVVPAHGNVLIVLKPEA